MYIALARRFNWTEQQIDAMDPDLVDELLTFIKAEEDEQTARNKER